MTDDNKVMCKIGFWLIPLCLLAIGCVTIPRDAPVLSAELGNRIQETRSAHLAVVHMYMDEKRAAVDAFVFKEWVPEFAREVFAQPAINEAWQQIVRSNDTTERLNFIVGLGPRLQARITNKRQELIAPLDELERVIERRLAENYDQLTAINGTLTALLAENAKATETRDQLLHMLDPKDELPTFIDKADEVVNMVVEKRNSIDTYRERINSIIDSVRERREHGEDHDAH